MKKDTPNQETSGLTIQQIDAIAVEICHAQALTTVLFEQSDEMDEIGASLFPMLRERLEKINQMVQDCQQGGRHA